MDTSPSIPPLFILVLNLLLASCFLPKSNSQITVQEEERRTLVNLKTNWGSPPALSSWGSISTRHCNWTGIMCTNGFVTGISLSNQSITNPIPSTICELKNLTHLDLSFNDIPKTFPTTLYNCSNIEYLDLSENLFVGELPDDIYHLSPRLTYLDLSANNFTGDIPSSIGQLPAIKSLLLQGNLFNGSYPSELGNLTTLEVFTLAYNPLTPATIPPEFGKMTRLKFLYMASMGILGEIPETLSQLTELEHLDLAMNSLSGRIPSWIWHLEKLQFLYLYHNKFSGDISGPVGALELLEIDVSMNALTGSIPEDFGKLKNLHLLFMYFNNLSGEIPAGIGLLPALSDIRLFVNNLSGILPPELGKHSDLKNLEVNENKLSGELPEYLCYRKTLTSLVVFKNNLTGTIPQALAECPTLDNIQLYRNSFSGEFPTSIWSANDLSTVIIHHNAFSGALPDKLPWNVTRLDISNNRFSGRIPSSAGRLQVLKASNNQISGKIPTDLSGISSLLVLQLGRNNLSGSIPANISELKSLTELNLSSNRISGLIPTEIGLLPVLTTLDLSHNQLSGSIPQQFNKLKLNLLNLSSNQLSGEIPISLQNQAYEESFFSNPGLCWSTNSIANLHMCGYKSDGSDQLSRSLLISFLVLGGIALCGTAVIGLLMYRRRRMDGRDLAAWKLTQFHKIDFMVRSVVRGLTDGNLIGRGGSGKVYRICVANRGGEIVAVKRICNGAKVDAKLEKEFDSEVRILGSIRHANIIKLLCCISSPDSKLLVYEYMENSSLDKWLHRRDRMGNDSAPLDWPTRIRIAVGAAKGLCYMHHDCSTPIVHRDVKSSNILLDSEFNAKIADFGLARMLVKAGEPESVSIMEGSFGYMAPECQCLNKVNEKVDVYSFGVVLLELTTGKAANHGDENTSLADWAWRHFQEDGELMDVVAKEMQDSAYLEEIEVVLTLGLSCTSPAPSHRPSMREVLQTLLRCERERSGSVLHGDFEVAPLLPPPAVQGKRGSRRKSLSDAGEVNDDYLMHVV
ncbi:uncharacterized protein [Typha angustifolia]|uniref:uncharacterized protein n=1 Tax=Typha angustifolia TaxID=59011 RepID=UPI003C2E82F8